MGGRKGVYLKVLAGRVSGKHHVQVIGAEQRQRCLIQSRSCRCVRGLLTTGLGRGQETAPVTLSISRGKCAFTRISALPPRSDVIRCSGRLGSLGARNPCRKCKLVLSPSIRNGEMKCCLKREEGSDMRRSLLSFRWLWADVSGDAVAGALSQSLCFILSTIIFSGVFAGGEGHDGFMLLSLHINPSVLLKRKYNDYSSTERLSGVIIIHKNRVCQSVIPETPSKANMTWLSFTL